MPIRQDIESNTLTFAAASTLVFLVAAPPQVSNLAVIIAVIMILGYLFDLRYAKRGEGEDAKETRKGITQVGVYVAADVLIFWILSNFVPIIPSYLSGVLLPGTVQTKTFSFLIAVAESQFFNVAAANFFIIRFRNVAAGSMASGLLAMIYHFFVYSTSGVALLVVFGAFTSFSFFNWKLKRASPAIIAHVIVDLLI